MSSPTADRRSSRLPFPGEVSRALGRRKWLALSFALGCALLELAAPPAAAATPALQTFELAVPFGHAARRVVVAVPAERSAQQPLPVLILLHGLGETGDQRAGSHAWLEPYGLSAAWDRVLSPPLPSDGSGFLSDDERASVSQGLARQPFRGLCVVCPYMPNPFAGGNSEARLQEYARWLAAALLPAVRDRIPEATRSAASTGLAGVSLGGYVALEIGMRAPESYATIGTVQGAFGAGFAPRYAERLARAFRAADSAEFARRLYIATSSADPYRAANQVLLREVSARGLHAEYCLRRGPHSQLWLRQVGSMDLLLWHDRALRSAQTPASICEQSCCTP